MGAAAALLAACGGKSDGVVGEAAEPGEASEVVPAKETKSAQPDANASEGDAAKTAAPPPCRAEVEPNDDFEKLLGSKTSVLMPGATCGTLYDGDVDHFLIYPKKRTRITFQSSEPLEFGVGQPHTSMWTFASGEGFTIGPTEEEWYVSVDGQTAHSWMIVVTELP
jgi:hypothetical protein